MAQPIYFYSDVKDLCSARNFTFEAAGNTENGDLCAVFDHASTRGVYACPASDEYAHTTMNLALDGD